MTTYYSPSLSGFLNSAYFIELPADAFEVPPELHRELIEGQSAGLAILCRDGGLSLGAPEASATEQAWRERLWRNRELARVDVELYKVEDGAATAGASEAAWRAYRCALRDWPESQAFPDQASRPAAPDAA